MTRQEYKNHLLSVLKVVDDDESKKDAALVEEWFSKSDEDLKSTLQVAALVISCSSYLSKWIANGCIAAVMSREMKDYIPEWIEVKTMIIPSDEKVH